MTAPLFEPCEPRLHLSATPTVAFRGGVVRVTGTSGGDAINIVRAGGALAVQHTPEGGVARTIFGTKLKKVRGMIVNAGAGDDRVTISGALRVRATIYGGEGDDNLRGGAGVDTIRGGPGDDGVFGGAGHDKLFGDAGVDAVGGESGNDLVVGGADPDVLVGGDGNDTLNAVDGNPSETVLGGAGRDTLLADFDLLNIPEGTPATFHQCEVVVRATPTAARSHAAAARVTLNVVAGAGFLPAVQKALPAVQRLSDTLQDFHFPPAVQRVLPAVQSVLAALESRQLPAVQRALPAVQKALAKLQDFHLPAVQSTLAQAMARLNRVERSLQ